MDEEQNILERIQNYEKWLNDNLQNINKILERVRNYEKWSKVYEVDTQVLLVEPILCLAGYNIYDPYLVKRASRNPRFQGFDIEVYKNRKLFLAIEVKAFSSSEFTINKKKKGDLLFDAQKKKWRNKNGDGVGQLRAYCLNWCYKLDNETIPILTNGKEWVFFDLKEFIKYPSQPVCSNMYLILSIENKEDFQKIIDILKSGYKKLQKFLKKINSTF